MRRYLLIFLFVSGLSYAIAPLLLAPLVVDFAGAGAIVAEIGSAIVEVASVVGLVGAGVSVPVSISHDSTVTSERVHIAEADVNNFLTEVNKKAVGQSSPYYDSLGFTGFTAQDISSMTFFNNVLSTNSYLSSSFAYNPSSESVFLQDITPTALFYSSHSSVNPADPVYLATPADISAAGSYNAYCSSKTQALFGVNSSFGTNWEGSGRYFSPSGLRFDYFRSFSSCFFHDPVTGSIREIAIVQLAAPLGSDIPSTSGPSGLAPFSSSTAAADVANVINTSPNGLAVADALVKNNPLYVDPASPVAGYSLTPSTPTTTSPSNVTTSLGTTATTVTNNVTGTTTVAQDVTVVNDFVAPSSGFYSWADVEARYSLLMSDNVLTGFVGLLDLGISGPGALPVYSLDTVKFGVYSIDFTTWAWAFNLIIGMLWIGTIYTSIRIIFRV